MSVSSLWSLVGSQNEITSSCNITNLTQHQLIVLFSSFLLLSCRLLLLSFAFSSATLLCMAKKFNIRSQVYLLFSTALVAPLTLHLLCFLPTCFVLLMGHREVINSQHSVSESAHQRRGGLKHSQLRILLIPQPKEKYPHGPQLSHVCVYVFVRVCVKERGRKKRLCRRNQERERE